MELADRYDVKPLRSMCEYLCRYSTDVPFGQRLQFAGRYGLSDLEVGFAEPNTTNTEHTNKITKFNPILKKLQNWKPNPYLSIYRFGPGHLRIWTNMDKAETQE